MKKLKYTLMLALVSLSVFAWASNAMALSFDCLCSQDGGSLKLVTYINCHDLDEAYCKEISNKICAEIHYGDSKKDWDYCEVRKFKKAIQNLSAE